MKCHHWRYEDNLGPRIGMVTETLPDGSRRDRPVVLDDVFAPSLGDVIAQPVFYDKETCPVCVGGPCPDCGEKAETELRAELERKRALVAALYDHMAATGSADGEPLRLLLADHVSAHPQETDDVLTWDELHARYPYLYPHPQETRRSLHARYPYLYHPQETD